jgi:hypothetical protein
MRNSDVYKKKKERLFWPLKNGLLHLKYSNMYTGFYKKIKY